MPTNLNITFSDYSDQTEKTTALIIDESTKLDSFEEIFNGMASDYLAQAIKAAQFEGSARTSMTVYAVPHTDYDQLLLIGAGDVEGADEQHWVNLGGYTYSQLARAGVSTASVVIDANSIQKSKMTSIVASFSMGALLRSYKFDIHKSQTNKGKDCKNDTEINVNKKSTELKSLNIVCKNPNGVEQAFTRNHAIAKGVILARDLVNQPANILGPSEFAHECEKLSSVGVEVNILDAKRLLDIGMHALLAVAQGSARPACVAVMRWCGTTSSTSKPLCFVGKGVCFDAGGISIKPSAGMEQMKGDMAGAACVTGLMYTLAARKAKIDVIGIVGLVENMPSGSAQRPGDVVSSLSGQSIEILNTDAEGRLVLADLLTYAERKFAPKIIINLATLTGAILIALGKEHAGLFSNNNLLAKDLIASGLEVDEKVWRMPLG
ncbi:MAG: leucyl aminopeptidase, partial [Hyphomicrobiaceae bacterium]|nr:leucyl aminopeptidase [Hyphomicrobiaceae bacterium]